MIDLQKHLSGSAWNSKTSSVVKAIVIPVVGEPARVGIVVVAGVIVVVVVRAFAAEY
jgi:hypothetical protein